MEASGNERQRRVDIGFYGTQVLSVRIKQSVYDDLLSALQSTEARKWHQVEADDSVFSVDLDKVVYLRLETDRDRVGF
jgi:hypothetical protein